MTTYYNNITQRTEQAIVAWLSAQAISFSPVIQGGISDGAKTLPSVTAKCQSAESDPLFVGNWTVNTSIEVRENADDTTEDDHHSHAGEIFSWFMTSTIAADLTAAATTDFTALFVIARRQNYALEGRSWTSTLELEIRATGSVIA